MLGCFRFKGVFFFSLFRFFFVLCKTLLLCPYAQNISRHNSFVIFIKDRNACLGLRHKEEEGEGSEEGNQRLCRQSFSLTGSIFLFPFYFLFSSSLLLFFFTPPTFFSLILLGSLLAARQRAHVHGYHGRSFGGHDRPEHN